MRYPRTSIPDGPVAVSIELPPGLFADDAAGASALAGEAIAVFRSLATGPALVLSVLSSAEQGSLEAQLTASVADFAARDAVEAWAGGASHSHAGLAWRHVRNGHVRACFATETGGVVLLACAEAPAGLWDDYGVFCERAMMTMEIAAWADAPVLPLRSGGTPPERGGAIPDPDEEGRARHATGVQRAEAAASRMIAQGDHEGAIAIVRKADSDILGANVLARLFETALEGAGSAARADELYRLAREWGWRSLPSPQTKVEGEQHEEALAEMEARLAGLRERAAT
jgi:hypothetical protein